MVRFADLLALRKEASVAAEFCLGEATHKIDEVFGEGYAKEHPDLVSAFMINAAIYIAAHTHAKAAANDIGDPLRAIADSIRGQY